MSATIKDFRLSALRAVANGALKADKLPSRLKILDWGTNDSTQGKLVLNERSAAKFDEIQKMLGRQRVAIDFEHNTVEGTPEFERTKEPRSVAGYGTPKIYSGDGMYLEDISWTPDGAASAKNYEDLSPAPWQNKEEGWLLALHSVGLTRTGSIFDLSFHSASTEIDAILSTFSSTSTNQNNMSKLLISAATLTAFAAAMGMPATAKEEDVNAELLKRLGTPAPAPATNANAPDLNAFNARMDKIEQLLGAGASLTTLSAQVTKLEETIRNNAASAEQSERDRLIAEAIRAGKVIPFSADLQKSLPLDVMKEVLGALPAGVIPFNARGRAKEGKPFGEKKGLALAIAAHEADTAGDPAYAARSRN